MKKYATLVLIVQIIAFPARSDCEADSNIKAFFDVLGGSWQGEAVTTPVGPRPYDISFERREAFWIYGQALPGAAVHHWGFYCENGKLWLRFLSTFRGNLEPTLLEATAITASEIRFKAKHPDFLKVNVRPEQTHSVFEILHHDKRHVLIELSR